MDVTPDAPDNPRADVCLTVDSEGDSPDQKNSSFLGIRYAIPDMIGRFARYGIRATFFVQEDEIHRIGSRFAAFWRGVQTAGHEIGLHVHGLIGKSPEAKQGIIRDALDRLRTAGLQVSSFRGGRYHINRDIIGFLDAYGVRADSSVVPGLREKNSDGVERCDHIGTPIAPYRISREDHRIPGETRIIEIPINRYPLESPSWAGILTGRELNDEVLFDYFYRIRRDRVIVVDLHSWDGLSPLIRHMLKRRRYAFIGPPLGLAGRIIGPTALLDRGYRIRIGQFLDHVATQKAVRFLPVREAAEAAALV